MKKCHPEAIGLIGQHGHIARQPGSIGRIKVLTGVHQHHQKTRDDADIVNEYDSLLIHVVSYINCIKIHYLADLAKSEPMRPLLSNAAASEKRLECWLPRWGRQNINTPAPDAAVLPRYIRETPAGWLVFLAL